MCLCKGRLRASVCGRSATLGTSGANGADGAAVFNGLASSGAAEICIKA